MKITYMLEDGAFVPRKAHKEDAGFDIRSPKFAIIPAESAVFIDTGVHVAIPEGYCGLLVSKSGLNVKHGIQSTGLIDAGYSGSIGVKLYNHSKFDYCVEAGNKISQLIILPVPEVEMIEGLVFANTERGDGGFGSSGK